MGSLSSAALIRSRTVINSLWMPRWS